jgi:glycosyltransferase involved in cell wall biosynthesis
VVTCFAEKTPPLRGLRQFVPEGVYTLPEYAGLKLLVPPFLQMLAHCHEERYTHLHVSTPGPVGLAALGIARILGLPVTGTYHTAFPQYAKALTEDGYVEGLCWQYMLWFHEQLDAVFVPSRATGAELTERGVTPAKIRLYPRGVDTARFHPSKQCGILRERFGLDDSMPASLYAGRVSREKNLPALCQAYRALLDDGTPMRLVVAGDGPYRAEMEAALEGTPAVFTGFLAGEDLCQLYASCDFLVFPSTTDTFGNVVLEAQASGIPVIVTDQGGPAENMQDGVTGLVVPGNDPVALARAMAELAGKPDLRARMGAAARAAMEARSFQSAFETLYGMYTGEPAPARPAGMPDPTSLLHPFATGLKAAAS